MQTNLATVSDVQAVARREALNAGKKILGVTAGTPRYVNVPDDSDELAVLEFVVDVYLLEHANQIVQFFAGNSGLKLIQNVLVASSAVGELIADLNTPVELQKNSTGQLQVVARAKVALPTLILDEYSLRDLGIAHVDEHLVSADGTIRDAWGFPIMSRLPRTSSVSTTTNRLSTLGELGTDDAGVLTGQFGVNVLQRVINSVATQFEIEVVESVLIAEG